jgi:hypothetical protein
MRSFNITRTLFAGALALSCGVALAPGARAANPACTGAQQADQEQLGQNVGRAQKADQEQLGQNVGRAQKADQEQLGAKGNQQFATNAPSRC